MVLAVTVLGRVSALGWRSGTFSRRVPEWGRVELAAYVTGDYAVRWEAVASVEGVLLAWRGWPMRWLVYHAPSGRLLAAARSFLIAAAIVADLVAEVPADAYPADYDTATEAEIRRARRAIAPVVARWCCEGDAVSFDRMLAVAVEVASEVPGWGQ